MKTLLLGLVLFCIVFMNSCVTLNRCKQKFGNMQPDTAYVIQVDTFEVTIKADTVKTTVAGERVTIKDSIPCPDLINKKYSGTSKKGNVKIDVEIKDNKLTADCIADSLEQVIITLQKEKTILKQQLTTITKQNQFVDSRPWYKKLPWYVWLVSSLLLLIFLLLIFKNLFK